MVEDYGSVSSVAFSPDGRVLAAAAGRTVKLWDVATGRLLRRIEENSGVSSVAFSPGGHALLSGAQNGQVKLWDITNAKLIRAYGDARDIPESGNVSGNDAHSVVFSPDGRLIASGNENSIGRIWDTATGELIAKLDGRGFAIEKIAFSSDGNTVATCEIGDNAYANYDHTLELWDLRSGKRIKTLARQSILHRLTC